MKLDVREEVYTKHKVEKKIINQQIVHMITIKKDIKNNRFILR